MATPPPPQVLNHKLQASLDQLTHMIEVERERRERLEEDLNDQTELHRNEVVNIKQVYMIWSIRDQNCSTAVILIKTLLSEIRFSHPCYVACILIINKSQFRLWKCFILYQYVIYLAICLELLVSVRVSVHHFSRTWKLSELLCGVHNTTYTVNLS